MKSFRIKPGDKIYFGNQWVDVLRSRRRGRDLLLRWPDGMRVHVKKKRRRE